MNYTKLISRSKQYKYSVNLCFDLYNENKLADFIPDVTTTEIIREYLGGIIRGNNNIHSRILYGSYGTGKSHLLTVLSAILGHINTKGKGLQSFLKLLASYDEELAEDIKKYAKVSKPYLVVPVYSDYEDFGKCITFSLKKELARNDISVCFKGFYDEALELVGRWLSGKESSLRLSEECKKLSIEVSELKKGLSTYNPRYEKIFNDIYTGMSYGAVFNSSAGSLIDNMNFVNEAIKDKYRGIVIIFDEFGRYVEDYGAKLKIKMIQDLAEYCDHTDYSNYLILVSHKQLSMYAGLLKKSIAEEWKKVEGRFKPTAIDIKYDHCLSLIGHIIPKTAYWDNFKRKHEKALNSLYGQAWDFKGFILPPVTEGRNPFEDAFPLHPITLFALDRLSKKVAQNERTFFTYLAGDEANSLFTQLKKLNLQEFHFIGLDAIYDYFELNIKEYKTDAAYVVYKKLRYALNKLGKNSKEYAAQVLKAIAVINIIADKDGLIADKRTLSSVIDCDSKELDLVIDSLEKKKIIKFMRHYGYYEFFDSSIFDLEGMIEEQIAGISDEMVVSILNEKFADFAIYPYSYNEKFHVTRVFVAVFAKKSDLKKKSFYNILPKYYDGAVIFVLDDQADEEEYKELTGIASRTILLVNGKSKEIELEVKRYIAIQYYYSKKDELAKDDPTVVTELKLYLNEQEAIVREMIRKWRFLRNINTFAIVNSSVVNISSERELSNVLSEIMEVAFNKTLIVNNDLLNKNNLTGALKLARKKALVSIMGAEDIYEGCNSLSPEYNVIRATLSKNGIVPNESVQEANKVNPKEFNRFENGTVSGKPVMTAIKKKLRQAESKHLPLSDLYKMLKSEPYGLRDGYISILVAYALRDYQNVSLYFHGSEHSYTEEELIKALSSPEDYTIFIGNWNDEEIAYVKDLEKIFANYLTKGDGLNRLEELFKAINTHYSSISKSARTTESFVSDAVKEYRNILNISHKDYNAFFFETLPKLNGDLQELAIQIKEIKNELETVEEKQYKMILHVVRRIFNIGEDEDIVSSLRKLYKNNWSKKRHKAFDYITNGVLSLISSIGKSSEEKFINDLAKEVTGFELTYWNDSKINDFEETLKDSVNKLNGYDSSKGLQEGEMKITIESADENTIISQFSKDDLSSTAQTMFNKIISTIDNFGDSISYEEKVSILAQILKEII